MNLRWGRNGRGLASVQTLPTRLPGLESEGALVPARWMHVRGDAKRRSRPKVLSIHSLAEVRYLNTVMDKTFEPGTAHVRDFRARGPSHMFQFSARRNEQPAPNQVRAFRGHSETAVVPAWVTPNP